MIWVNGYVLLTPTQRPWKTWGGAVTVWADRDQAQRVADAYNQMPSLAGCGPFEPAPAQAVIEESGHG